MCSEQVNTSFLCKYICSKYLGRQNTWTDLNFGWLPKIIECIIIINSFLAEDL